MNKIVKFAVQYPVTVLMLTLAICLLGFISYNRLGVDLFPNLKNPALYVDLQAGERPPEEMEKQYVKTIESLAARQDGVKNVSSTCRVGYARITVEYDWEQDMESAFLDLQRGLSAISQNSEVTSLNVLRYDVNAKPVMTFSLVHQDIHDMDELRKIAENTIRNELVRIEGVADIQLNGQEYVYVEIKTNSYLLEAHHLTIAEIASKIEGLLRHVSGGTIVDDNIQYTVKGVNIIRNIEDIGNIIVTFKEPSAQEGNALGVKAPVYLKDVAEIAWRNKEPDNIARFNGIRCLSIHVYKENKYNTVKVVDAINEKLDELRQSMPDYAFHVIADQGTFIRSAIGEVEDAALLGILLAIIILYVFLRRINTTVIISLSIPISIIATFNLMYFNQLTLNIMTLGGLALGAGMLVDNAIVVIENIFRNKEKGLSSKEAAVKGTAEVGGAITSSTLTTIVVFLPIVYIQGAAGELFKEQAWTVAFSLLSSLFVAVLLIPMLASKFLKSDGVKKAGPSVQIKGYGNFVGRLLGHRYKVLLGALILMVCAYLLVPFIGMEFMPKSEANEFNIQLTLEPGTRLQHTDLAVVSVENVVRDIGGEHIDWIYTLTGPSHTDAEMNEKAEGENQAEMKVKLKKGGLVHTDYFISGLTNNMDIPDRVEITYEVEQSTLQSVLGTGMAPLVVEVRGEEPEILEGLAEEIKQKMSLIPGVYELKTSQEDGVPTVNISIDRLKSGIYGVEMGSLIQQVNEKLNGKIAGSFEEQGELANIEIKVPEISLSRLQNIEILQNNKKYRLGEIAVVSVEKAPEEINRNNQNRIVSISALLEKGYSLSEVTPAVGKIIHEMELPSKYSAKITGEEEKREESFGGLSFALILSIVLVYMVMAAQFESLRHPFTILLTIPLAGVGTIFLFLLTGATLNMMAFIGIIMLAGIAVNSSIILVDRINQLKAEGLELKEAIMSAAQQRIRPIIMTSLTTILALLPMCFGFGESESLRSPMALAVIGGLVTSTLLTLIVIPCIYYVLDSQPKNEV